MNTQGFNSARCLTLPVMIGTLASNCAASTKVTRTPNSTISTQNTNLQPTSTTTPPSTHLNNGDVEQFYASDGSSSYTVSVTGISGQVTPNCPLLNACGSISGSTHYVAVEVTLYNDGLVEQFVNPSRYFALLSSSQQQYSPALLMYSPSECDASFTGNKGTNTMIFSPVVDLIAGESVDGCVVFNVPNDFVAGEVVFYSRPPVFWNLS